MNGFDAGLAGVYNVSLVCPAVAAATGKTIYAGSAANLDGSATIWVHNDALGTKKFENVAIHAVLVILPQSGQLLLRLDPIKVQQVTITEESGDGFFDSASGRLDLHLVLNVSGPFSGTIDIVISTEKTITPPQGNPVRGQRRDTSGHITLVGDAPIVGPPFTTHGWLEIDGNLSPI
jgi:hypothetical protein